MDYLLRPCLLVMTTSLIMIGPYIMTNLIMNSLMDNKNCRMPYMTGDVLMIRCKWHYDWVYDQESMF